MEEPLQGRGGYTGGIVLGLEGQAGPTGREGAGAGCAKARGLIRLAASGLGRGEHVAAGQRVCLCVWGWGGEWASPLCARPAF